MNRAEMGIEPGPVDRVEVVPVADDYFHSLLVFVCRDARITLQIPRGDLGKVEAACREGRWREEARQRAADLEAERVAA